MSDRPGFLQPFAKEYCHLSRSFVVCHLLNACVELRDSFHITIICGQYMVEFLLVFRDVLERTLVFAFLFAFLLLFLFVQYLRSIDFAIRVTMSASRDFWLRLLLRLRWFDPKDDPDDDVSA